MVVRLVTVAEFEEFSDQEENQDRRFELIDGEIVEKMPTEEHGIIVLRIGSRLLIFVEARGLGRVAVEPRHRVPDDEHNARLPDIAFTSASRVLPVTRRGSVPQMPDLVVEVKSPDDTYARMRKKAAYYLEHGSRLVWLVYPEKQLVEVYRSGTDSEILNIDDVLTGHDVLPGFELPINDIFVGAD